jgi:hypothetical protein
VVGSNPTINYAAFTGGFGMVAAIVGVAALFVEPLAGLVMAAIDTLASLLFLAGGIVSVYTTLLFQGEIANKTLCRRLLSSSAASTAPQAIMRTGRRCPSMTC